MTSALRLGAFALLIAAPAALAAPRPASVEIIHAWIAPPPGGAPTAAGYAILRNGGRTADTYLGASSPAAQRVELHAMSMAGDIMRMRPVQGGVPIAAGQSLTLAPGGYHFMLVHPKRPLKSGGRVPVTLTFARAGAVKAIFVVQAPPLSKGQPSP